MYDSKICADLTTAARRAYQNRLQSGSGGNLSARLDGQSMLVKASGGSFADCAADGNSWLPMTFSGKLFPGTSGKPTREWKLHAALLQGFPQIGGVVHCHSPWSIAWADRHAQIPMATWHSRLKFGCAIPVVDVQAAVVPAEKLNRIAALFRENPDLPGFVLRGHGLVAVGRDVLEAEHAAEMLEETAKICVLETLLGRVTMK